MESCNWSNLKISCWQRSFAPPLTFSTTWVCGNLKTKVNKNNLFYQIFFLLLFEIFVWNEWQVVDSQIRTHSKQFILINRSNVHVSPPIPNITIKYFEGSHTNPSNVSHIFLSMSKSFALSNWWKLHWYIKMKKKITNEWVCKIYIKIFHLYDLYQSA